MAMQIDLRIMSGVEDGRQISLELAQGDGLVEGEDWLVRFGRHEENDVHLRYDSFASRFHARLRLAPEGWRLEDCDSKNGTFVEHGLEETRVSGQIALAPGTLFRVGRTWFLILE